MDLHTTDRRPHRTLPRRAGVLAVAIATITLLTSCVLNPSPARTPPAQSSAPSPTPTVEPTPEEPRYGPIDVGFCDRAKLYELASEVGLDRRTEYSRTVPTATPEPWEPAVRETIAGCQFPASAHRPDNRLAWLDTSVTLELRSFPKVAGARDKYYEVVLYRPPSPGWSSVLEEIDGWWDEGVSIEYDYFGDSFSGRDTGFGLDIHLRHANVYLHLTTSGTAPEVDAPQAREMLRELAWLVVDETMRHISEIEPN